MFKAKPCVITDKCLRSNQIQIHSQMGYLHKAVINSNQLHLILVLITNKEFKKQMKTIKLLVSGILLCLSLNVVAQDMQAVANQIKLMTKEPDPEKNVLSLHHTIKTYKLDTIKNAEDIDVMKGIVALSFLEAGKFPKFEAYIKLIKNKFNQTSYLNMAADILCKNKKHLGYAETIAKQTISLYDSYRNDPSARPAGFPLEDWNRFMKMAAYPYYDTYAQILHANGKDQAALSYQELALKDRTLEDMQQASIELYTTLLINNGQIDQAYAILFEMARLGKSSLKMDQQLQQLHIKKTGNQSNSTLFLDSIQRNVKLAYQIELAKKMMVNVEAPDFKLLDLNGKRVSLRDLRGKVIVLDFWATWCAPCIAAMPAMKQLSNKHPQVVFLFIATQENGADATQRVKAYVKKHQFPLNVLMDQPMFNNPKIFSVANAYKVKGIPAKMVIDQQGKLRFATNGYTTDAELVNELEAMITLSQAQ